MSADSVRLEAPDRTVKLGRLPATDVMRRRTLPLGPYFKKYGAKPPPAAVTYHTKAARSLGEMLGNDQYGDCVIAATMHGVGVWSANEPGGSEAVASTKETVAQYQRICGPGDNGCYIPSVLDYFRDKGMTVAGKPRKIDGYVSVNPRDELLVKTATHLFGGLHLGVNWPADWSRDAKPGGVLKPTNSTIVGGHAIQVVGYDDVGLQVSTWGFVCTLAWAALASPRWVDECYAMLGEDWYDAHGATAAGAGVNVEKLRADLAIIKGGGTPEIPPDEPPSPVPPVPPVPVPGVLTLTGMLDFFGQTLPIRLTGNSVVGSGGPLGFNWWVIVTDVLALLSAARKRDWTALALAVEQLLAHMGTSISGDDRRGISDAIRASADNLPAVESPSGREDRP